MPVNSVRVHPEEPKRDAKPPQQRTSLDADSMAGEALAPKLKPADNVVLKLKLSMAARPARREPNAA